MTYSFDNFEINHTLREISLAGELLSVEPKVYDLIVFFVENAHQAISKDVLQDAIWPSLEVSETAVTRAIMKARKVLTDEASPQNYIQTIHGHGYKFIAEIKTTNTVETNQAHESASKASVNKVLAYVLLLSLAAVGFIYISQLKTESHLSQVLVLPLENDVQDENYAWASLGLMALTSKIIAANSNTWVVPDTDSIKATELLKGQPLPLSTTAVEQLNDAMDTNYIVAAKLSANNGGDFELRYHVYHPKGTYADNLLKGANPTALAQEMAKQISQLLPGKVTQQNQVVVSEDSFTNELYSRGMSYHIQGFVDKAQNYYELAIEQDPTLLLPKHELAVIKRKQNKLEESRSDLMSLLNNLSKYSNKPSDKAMILNSLGVTQLRMLDYDSAMQNFNEAYALSKQHDDVRLIVKTTYNMSIIQRRKQNLDAARKWAAEALATVDKNNLPKRYSVVYLQGQIERDSGNLDKALNMFKSAQAGFQRHNELRQASTVSNAISNLLKSKGRFKEALAKMDENRIIKQELNDILGLTDLEIGVIEIHMAQGNFVRARSLLGTLKVHVEKHNIESRQNYLLKLAITLDFNEERYDQVIAAINTQVKDYKSKTLDMIKLKADQQAGKSDVIKQWLEEHKHYQSDKNNMMRLYWLDFENFYLEHHGSSELLIQSYRNRLALSRLMGKDALSVKLLLKSGYQHLKSGALEVALAHLNEINTYALDWWQIKLYDALLLRAQGDHKLAIDVANQAKQQAGTAWLNKYELALVQMNNRELTTPVAALLF